jgi:hypothetical protein
MIILVIVTVRVNLQVIWMKNNICTPWSWCTNDVHSGIQLMSSFTTSRHSLSSMCTQLYFDEPYSLMNTVWHYYSLLSTPCCCTIMCQTSLQHAVVTLHTDSIYHNTVGMVAMMLIYSCHHGWQVLYRLSLHTRILKRKNKKILTLHVYDSWHTYVYSCTLLCVIGIMHVLYIGTMYIVACYIYIVCWHGRKEFLSTPAKGFVWRSTDTLP